MIFNKLNDVTQKLNYMELAIQVSYCSETCSDNSFIQSVGMLLNGIHTVAD